MTGVQTCALPIYFSFASGVEAAGKLLSGPQRPSAIIASNDQMALATLEVARLMGLTVPQDLSLISFDNTPLVHFTQPPLTAVDQPIAATTSKAVELLIAAQKGDAAPKELTVVRASIFVRESVAPLADAPGA